eukprot:CAMPEP_0118922966 /NCGR_PEP_ID=MMETSP1169-20130426/1681_1 /TAXON_ID=36882 /ORGANISM="Pyramimonas obovata, Strain CCMP722" /LENGTH=603 /DNA_ID=CAMNT_0006863895 /DNA_START=409 /DNA_END=2220 /DNA_ORIENTATION=+
MSESPTSSSAYTAASAPTSTPTSLAFTGEGAYPPSDLDVPQPPPFTPPLNALLQEVNDQVVENATVEEVNNQSYGILIFLLIVVSVFFIGYQLKRLRVSWLHESSAALLLGCVLGLLVNVVPNRDFLTIIDKEDLLALRESLLFHDDLFFLVLLPPIIFEAGFNTVPTVLRDKFWYNLDAICTYAFLGTFLSSAVVGLGVALSGYLGLCTQLTPLHSLCFGSLISATDPVTTLAIFQELGADLDLYALVFGESVLNDAVAIVLYQSMVSFQDISVDSSNIFNAFLQFCNVFGGSLFIGFAVALSTTLVLKYTHLYQHEYEMNEASILVLMPYISYIIAVAFDLSGIIAILFCGIAMARYTVCHVSHNAYAIVHNMYRMTAGIFECLIFVYMGSAIFLFKLPWGTHIPLAVVSLFWCVIGRFINIWLCTPLINSWRNPARQIGRNFKQGLLHSGLRGGIAFALALSTQSDLHGQDENVAIVTSTIGIVLVTVLLVGGTTPTVVNKLQLRAIDNVPPNPDAPHSPSLGRSLDEEGGPDKDAGVATIAPRPFKMLMYLIKLEDKFMRFVTSKYPREMEHVRLPTSTNAEIQMSARDGSNNISDSDI